MNAESMHKLLVRQLRRHFGSLEAVPADLEPLFTAVEMAYRQADADRELIERSMENVSRELADRLMKLRQAIGERDEVQHSLSLLAAAIDGSDHAVLMVDQDGQIVRYNALLTAYFPGAQDVIARGGAESVWSVIAAQLEAPTSFARQRHAVITGEATHGTELLRTTDGRRLELSANPQRLEERTVGWVWRFRDVTERHLLEEKLRQSTKMEAVGQLAGGIAHDFNNLITIVQSNLRFLVQEPELSPYGREFAEEARLAAERAGDLTQRLLAFGRKQTLRTTTFGLSESVVGIEPMLRRAVGPTVTVLTAHAASPTLVTADRAQLDQVLLNLVLNARDAMPEGGEIRITTRETFVSAPRSVVLGEVLQPGAYAELTVTDSGIGILPDLRDRIFEPFFTTKPVGHGTGLGLAMVHGIVRQSGGFIEVESAPGKGTTMRLLLPVGSLATAREVDEVALPRTLTVRPPLRAASPGAGSRTVLVVEDESGVRKVIRNVLRAEGYTVLEAGDGLQAKIIFEQHPGSIDLLVGDVMMPGLGGPALVRKLRRERPLLPVLLISGFADPNVIADEGLATTHTRFLAKPFTNESLAAAVRESIALQPSAA